MLFKKVIGEASFGQVSLIFTVIALLNTILLSPVVAAFYFSGYEVVVWSHLPWPNLLIAAALSLGEETNVPTPVDKASDNHKKKIRVLQNVFSYF